MMTQDFVQEAETSPLDLENVALSDVIDIPALQEMMNEFYDLIGLTSAIIDIKGEVLVSCGWQDICVKFHRAVPESCEFCHESDIILSSGVAPGTFKAYRCKNNLWDMVTPLMLGDKHIGNIFMGQMLYDDEEPDYELFRAQAVRYGYDEAAYLEALDRVPRFSRTTVNKAMNFCSKLAQMISRSNYGNMVLKKTVAERERLQAQLLKQLEELRDSNAYLDRTKETLQNFNTYNRTLIEASLDSLVTINPDGKISDVNSATEQVTGCQRNELIGTDFSDYFTEPDKAREGYQRVFRNGIVRDYPLEIRHRGGHITPVLYNATVYNDYSGNILGVFASARDITRLRQVEMEIQELNSALEQRVIERTAQLKAANREMESFAYSVSHDLRAPLRSIDGFSLALLEDYGDKLDEEGKGHLRRVRAATQRMAQLIDDILKLSRITRSELNFEMVDLSALAVSSSNELRSSDPQRNVEFIIKKEVKTKGDASLLKVVLDNLLGNAWKFSSGHAAARIEFGVTTVEGENVYFVRDDGAGFDMNYADKLFITFQRLHTEQEFPGTGVGLALVRHVINRHGGRVWAESAVEQGATFYFTLGSGGEL